MAWIDLLKEEVICLDTAPIIYYLEEKKLEYKKILDPFFDMVEKDECVAITSVVSITEGLVLPIRNKDDMLINKFRNFFYHTRIQTVEVTAQIAEEAVRLRAAHNIHTPDAIQVATAILAGASAFLTNDFKLASIPDIKVLVLDKLKTDS